MSYLFVVLVALMIVAEVTAAICEKSYERLHAQSRKIIVLSYAVGLMALAGIVYASWNSELFSGFFSAMYLLSIVIMVRKQDMPLGQVLERKLKPVFYKHLEFLGK